MPADQARNKARLQTLSAQRVVLEARVQNARVLKQKVEALFSAANQLGDPHVAQELSSLLTAISSVEQSATRSLNEVNKERQSFGLR